MSKIVPTSPTFILLFGLPGSGKTCFARQFANDIQAAHVQVDRFRFELFDNPTFSSSENAIVSNLADYMTEEFLKAGISVLYDTASMRISQRKALYSEIKKSKARVLLVWLQIDIESAFSRVVNRDRRKIDNKYAASLDRTSFDALIGRMQNPHTSEDYVVISGKHNYQTQRSTVLKKFFDLGLIEASTATDKLVKPGLVNLIPNYRSGRVDNTRRNILIHG